MGFPSKQPYFVSIPKQNRHSRPQNPGLPHVRDSQLDERPFKTTNEASKCQGPDPESQPASSGSLVNEKGLKPAFC